MMDPNLLKTLRNPSVPSPEFRQTTRTLSWELAHEVAQKMDPAQQKKLILVPILRAGLALLPAFSKTFLEAPIGIFGIQRDEKSALARMYYERLPKIDKEASLLLLDPMIATGGTAILALKTLAERGAHPHNFFIVSVIASKQGVAALKGAFPHVTAHIAAVDPELSLSKMIVPGLGDFGDRYFGTD